MNHAIHEAPTKGFEVVDGGKARRQDGSQVPDQTAYEENIVDRFHHLTGDIQHFASSIQAACLSEYALAREILQELAEKQGKLAWTIGVAKRLESSFSNASQRQTGRRMWPDIERMLADLESTLGLLSRLQFVEGHWRVPPPVLQADGGAGDAADYSDVS